MLVFISYSGLDHEIAERLAIQLGLLGHDVQFEAKTPGGSVGWHQVFESIAACDLLVFAITRQSLHSNTCALEYRYAAALGKRVLGVMLEEVHTRTFPAEMNGVVLLHDVGEAEWGLKLAVAVAKLPDGTLRNDVAPVYPEVTIPLRNLYHQVKTLPQPPEQQRRLFNNLVEFTERVETFDNAAAILRQLQADPRTNPALKADVDALFRQIEQGRTRRATAGTRRRVLRDIGLAVAGALIVLVAVRGLLFLRAASQPEEAEITPQADVVPDGTAETTPDGNTPATAPATAPALAAIASPIPEQTAEVTDIAPANDIAAPEITQDANDAALLQSANVPPETTTEAIRPTETDEPTAIPPTRTPNLAATQASLQTSIARTSIARTRIAPPTLPPSTATPPPTDVPVAEATTAIPVTVVVLATATPSLTPTNSEIVISNTPIVPTQAANAPTAQVDADTTIVYTGIVVADTPQGAEIGLVSPSVNRAGVRVGDVVRMVNLQRIRTGDEFRAAMNNLQAYVFVNLRVLRDGTEQLFRFQLNPVDFEITIATQVAPP